MMLVSGAWGDFPGAPMLPKHKEPKTCPECQSKGHDKYYTGTAESRHKMRRRR